MRTSSKTIHNPVELSVSLGSWWSSHTLLFLSLCRTIVFVIRCVRLCLLHRATKSTLVTGTTGEGAFLLVSTELVIGSRDALVISSPFLIRKLHILILHVRPIDLNLLKLLDVAIYLGHMNLSSVILIEYFENRLIFLFIYAKVIGCHYCKACRALLII